MSRIFVAIISYYPEFTPMTPECINIAWKARDLGIQPSGSKIRNIRSLLTPALPLDLLVRHLFAYLSTLKIDNAGNPHQPVSY
jgi:hypothetical protein